MAKLAARYPLVTLLTDFGTRDPYVAAMKGVLLSLCPRARLLDISHEVPAHDVLAGSFVLAQVAPHFPKETLHVIVVDPDVGTDRRILAARFGGQYFLFPDNGVITFLAALMPLEQIVVVRNTRYVPSPASKTFHGRDIFAPVAARIMDGLELDELGPQPETYRLLHLPAPREENRTIIGQVIYVDSFGNLISNIPADLVRTRFQDLDHVRVLCSDHDVGAVQGAYGFVQPGQPLALINSMLLVEVAVNCGRACDVLPAAVGAQVRILPK